VLLHAGHDVTVFERTPDVGGVWSATRRYPGLTTQSPKAQYSFSDFAIAEGLPGMAVGCPGNTPTSPPTPTTRRRTPALRLGTEVTAAHTAVDGGWTLDSRARGGRDHGHVRPARHRQRGSSANPPSRRTRGWPSSRRPAGACARAPISTTPRRRATGNVLVVGYGKSACDVNRADQPGSRPVPP